MCEFCSRLHYAQGATELKNRTLGFIGYCHRSPHFFPLLSTTLRWSPMSATERKYHLATARTDNEANTWDWEGIKEGPNLRGRL